MADVTGVTGLTGLLVVVSGQICKTQRLKDADAVLSSDVDVKTQSQETQQVFSPETMRLVCQWGGGSGHQWGSTAAVIKHVHRDQNQGSTTCIWNCW